MPVRVQLSAPWCRCRFAVKGTYIHVVRIWKIEYGAVAGPVLYFGDLILSRSGRRACAYRACVHTVNRVCQLFTFDGATFVRLFCVTKGRKQKKERGRKERGTKPRLSDRVYQLAGTEISGKLFIEATIMIGFSLFVIRLIVIFFSFSLFFSIDRPRHCYGIA